MGKIFPGDLPEAYSRMHDDGNGNYWFYHKGSFPTDEPMLYRQIISTANSEVEIWDPHFNVEIPNRDQDIFDLIKPNITIKILTTKGLDAGRTYFQKILSVMEIKFPQQLNIRFGLRVIDKGNSINIGNWLFHDRFLIIDRSEVFIVGGSVGWHIVPIASTGIYKVENFDTKQFIISLFIEYWKQAASEEIPVRYLHP